MILFALPVLLAVLTWNQSQAEARACVVRWQVIASIVYFLATSPMNLTTDTIFVILLLAPHRRHRASGAALQQPRYRPF